MPCLTTSIYRALAHFPPFAAEELVQCFNQSAPAEGSRSGNKKKISLLKRAGIPGEEMDIAICRPLQRSFSTEALCARILERHREVIRVQKTELAIANLGRIIVATLKLSNKKGFHATSLRDLARASGLSMGGLYTYFPNKPMLLSMILGEVVTTTLEVLREPPDNVLGDAAAHLNWVVETHIRLTEAMRPWFVFAFMEAKSFPSAERQMAVDAEAAIEKIVADVLAAGVTSGAFMIPDVTLTASLIKPLLQDWYVKHAKYRKRGIPIETFIEGVKAFIGEALSARVRADRVRIRRGVEAVSIGTLVTTGETLA
jgi:TetR/AcrR family transcriptional regulator, cholesterol catabolism regulator